MRVLSIIAGIGLAVLWLAAWGSPYSSQWLAWTDGAGALLCFVVAGNSLRRPSAVGGPLSVAVFLFVLSWLGMYDGGAPYQDGWTFAFACTMVIAAIFGGTSYRQLSRSVTPPPFTRTRELSIPDEDGDVMSDEDRRRRSA